MTSGRGGSLGRLFIVPVMLALVLGAGAMAPTVSANETRNGPKVVIIVGPTGSLTAGFKAEAEAAARAARRYTNNVVTLYSPHATWQAVRPALQGASIVVYMGHGNGFPSIHRASPFPRTQNGLGLNPAAGGDDHTHRYYGEHFLARDVKLAPGAIVLLHHLCYAAGNSEPGLPEGPHDVAMQRVENFAAGWLAAGASAVVAEAYFAPRYYVSAILGTSADIETIWRSSPTYKGNVDAWASRRTAKATAFIDPTRGGRYGRSLVVLGSGARTQLQPAANTERDSVGPDPGLAAIEFGAPTIEDALITWSTVEVSLPYRLGGGRLPADVMVGAEWRPVELDLGPLTFAERAALYLGIEPTDEEAEETEEPEEASDTELDGMREPLPAEVRRRSLRVPLLTPELPGTYELVLTLHDEDGQLLKPDGEALETPQVYVARPLSAQFEAPPELETAVGETATLSLTLANNGVVAWEQSEGDVIEERGPDPFRVIPPLPANLVGYAVRAGNGNETVGSETVGPELLLFAVEARVSPAASSEFNISFASPGVAGVYVLFLDVVTPSYGSLADSGVAPAIVLVHVGPGPVPAPEPSAR